MESSSSSLLSSLFRFHVFLINNIYYECFSSKHRFQIFSLKRVFSLVFLYIFIVYCVIWNHLGFLLDEILFSGWREEGVSEPLFIVGNARSGTTLMHRLLTMDDSRFTTMRTWEIIFAPSVSWRMLFWFLYDIDRFFLFGTAYHCVEYADRLLFGGIRIHPCGLFQAEEDEWVLVHVFYSQLVLLFYPAGLHIPAPSKSGGVIKQLWGSNIGVLPDFENALTEPLKRSIFNFYRNCVKRHLYAHNRRHRRKLEIFDRRSSQDSSQNTRIREYHATKQSLVYVSKNPVFTTRLRSLHAAFPDMRVVCMIRDPVHSVPSMVSYISKVWQLFNSPIDPYPNTSELIGFCVQHYLQPLEYFSSGKIDPNHCMFVYYHELLKDMTTTVVTCLDTLYPSLYHADETQKSRFVARLQSYALMSRQVYSSDHSYSVANCCGGLTIEKLKSLMKQAYHAHPALLTLN